jgi:hypothetical protein
VPQRALRRDILGFKAGRPQSGVACQACTLVIFCVAWTLLLALN